MFCCDTRNHLHLVILWNVRGLTQRGTYVTVSGSVLFVGKVSRHQTLDVAIKVHSKTLVVMGVDSTTGPFVTEEVVCLRL